MTGKNRSRPHSLLKDNERKLLVVAQDKRKGNTGNLLTISNSLGKFSTLFKNPKIGKHAD